MTMRPGTDTGSAMNHLLSRATRGEPEPTVGMGATFLEWTDRNPATIIEVGQDRGRTVIACQGDRYQRTDDRGMSEMQDYAYERDPEGEVRWFRKSADGSWQQVRKDAETGRWKAIRGGGSGLRIGTREKYHDFSF